MTIIQPIKDAFEASGFNPQLQTLKYFEDDYGLRSGSADEDNDEDEEQDEDEDADYELVSGEEDEEDEDST